MQAEPSWLADAAAYDAVAAQLEEDDMSALEILSDDDDSPMVNAVRSQARLNLSTLEQLLLSDDEDDDGQDAEQQPQLASSALQADAQSSDSMLSEPQSASLADRDTFSSEGAFPRILGAAARAFKAVPTSSHSELPNQAPTSRSEQHAPLAADPPSSPQQVALGHNGRPRPVLSDVTGSFPAEQQPSQQSSQRAAEQDSGQLQNNSGFQLQRRGRLPRVCRNLLTGGDNTSDDSSSSSSQAEGSTQGDWAPKLRVTLRSAVRAQAPSEASLSSDRAGVSQPARCTRRQAKLTQQSTQQTSAGNNSSDDDSGESHQQKRNVRSTAVSGAPSFQSSQVAVSHSADGNEASTADQAPVRKNRSRLQLNRNVSKAKPAGS